MHNADLSHGSRITHHSLNNKFRRNRPMTESAYSPGLEGVIAGVSSLSHIDAENNVLTYRGYNVQDLCDNATFEEVAYLLFHGELPSADRLAEFTRQLASEREVPEVVYEALRLFPDDSEPMDWLK